MRSPRQRKRGEGRICEFKVRRTKAKRRVARENPLVTVETAAGSDKGSQKTIGGKFCLKGSR